MRVSHVHTHCHHKTSEHKRQSKREAMGQIRIQLKGAKQASAAPTVSATAGGIMCCTFAGFAATNDRHPPEELAGKRLATLDYDEAAKVMVPTRFHGSSAS